MARTPYATETCDTPQKSARVPDGQVSYIIIHHAASASFDGVIALEMGAREVSSTVIIKDDQVASMFDESYRAWSLSSQYWDSVSLSSETCDETLAPTWTISEASYASLAKVVADWCVRYNIVCDRVHIMGHREVYTRYGASYATACPGGIDLDRVVADANKILSGAPAPVKKILTVIEGEEMSAPIYARGDKLDVWYALYSNCQDATVARDSGQIYSGRRKVQAGERAIVEAYQKQTGKMHPLSDQTGVVVIPQDVFDAINKVQGSDA